MSGQLLLRPPDAPDEPHLRVRFDFEADWRRASCASSTSGCSAGWPSSDSCHPTGCPAAERARRPGAAHIAPVIPLGPAFDRDVRPLRRRAAGPAVAPPTGLKRALLDQTLVSGIGNIYADEALWRARLHGAPGAPRP